MWLLFRTYQKFACCGIFSDHVILLPLLTGADSLSMWLEDPTYPNTTLSWNVIHGKKVVKKLYLCSYSHYHILTFFLLQGTGMITQEIFRSSYYYVALGNLEDEVEVFFFAFLCHTCSCSWYN